MGLGLELGAVAESHRMADRILVETFSADLRTYLARLAMSPLPDVLRLKLSELSQRERDIHRNMWPARRIVHRRLNKPRA